MRTIRISRVAGDTGKPILLTYRDHNLTGWDLKMQFRYRGTRRLVVIDATEIDLSAGEVKFDFSPGDLVEGVADLEFQLTDDSGMMFTIPSCAAIRLDVRKAVE